ncbi:MAG: SLC13 family permease [Desulfovibrio sp.]
MSRKIFWAGVPVLLAILAYAALAGAGPSARLAGAATTFLIACWGLRILSEGTAAMLFFLVLAVSGTVPSSVVFSGFTTPAFWLVFSGLIIGRAIRESGLSRRLAGMLGAKRGRSYPLLLGRIIAGGVIFAFFLPSGMGRIVILTPLLVDFAKSCGFSEKDKGYVGILLAGILGTYLIPFAILPANLPNVILSGAAKALYGMEIGYLRYFVLHFPVLGLLKSLLVWGCLCLLFPATLADADGKTEPVPWNGREIGTILVLLAALACWMTDSLHGVSPGWVSLAAAILLLAPASGWFGPELLTGIKMDTLLFVACAIGVGNVIQASGLAAFMGAHLLGALPLEPGAGAHNLPVLLGVFLSTGLLTSLPGIPSVFVPLAQGIAQSVQMPLSSLLMLLVPAFSTVLLPYQGPPLIVAVHAARIPYRAMLLACLLLAAGTILLLFPLDLLWWKLLGVPLSGV